MYFFLNKLINLALNSSLDGASSYLTLRKNIERKKRKGKLKIR